jgi:hypothetical protein
MMGAHDNGDEPIRTYIDAQENAVLMEREREGAISAPSFPCPDDVWVGPYAEVADILGFRDWRVWVGVTAALSARAHRNLNLSYHAPLHGMGYYLLVAASSTGKSLATRLCRALLPSAYRCKYSVESGQALPYLIAERLTNEEGILMGLQAVPTALLLSEWTLLLDNMDIHGSSLLPKLNECYDGDHPLEVNRTEKRGVTDSISVSDPVLTLLGTTTLNEFRASVKAHHIKSGFINRHFIVPGSFIPWRYDADYEAFPEQALRAYAEENLPLGHAFGHGVAMRSVYDVDAAAINNYWGTQLFEPLHNEIEEEDEASVYKRLHVYSRRIPALLAWSMRSSSISLSQVRAGHAAVESSLSFLRYLFAEKVPSLTPTMQAYSDLDNLILHVVASDSSATKNAICQRLKRHGGYAQISQQIEKLLHAGGLIVQKQGEKGTKKILQLPE